MRAETGLGRHAGGDLKVVPGEEEGAGESCWLELLLRLQCCGCKGFGFIQARDNGICLKIL